MAEQYLEHSLRALHGLWQVCKLGERRLPVVFHTDEGYAVTFVMKDVMLIVQQFPSHCFLLPD